MTAVIPHLDRADLLKRALRSLSSQELPDRVSLEILVVANGGAEEVSGVARAFGARTLPLGRNMGVSRALNRGIAEATGDWIALVNDDVEASPGWLGQLLRGALRADAWFATGKTFDATRRGVIDGAGDAVCRGGAAWRLGHGRPDGPEFSEPRPTFFPSATATLFRREFFERAGTFDESMFAYLEDVDLGMRAASLGLEGTYVPAAEAWHAASSTGGRWSARSVAWITRHQLHLLAKHYSEDMLLRFGRAILVAQLLWAALAVSRGRARPWLRGLAAGLADAAPLWRAAARSGEPGLVAAMRASEAEIAEAQRATGWDTYWRWYFRLAPPVRHGRS